MINANKRVFILGANGFIGRYLKDKFSLDNSIEVLGHSSRTCNLLSLRDIHGVLSSAGDDDALIIASAITRIKENSYASMIKNIQMIENCCRAVSKKSIGHITFLSTIDVYGVNIERNAKINESFLPNPDDYYSVSKIASEYLLKKVCSEKSIPLTILRLSGVYGPGDNFGSTIGLLVKGALSDKNIIIYGPGNNLRDYIYVDDIYQIVKSAIDRKKNVLVNVGTGKSLTIKEIAILIKSLLSFPIDIQHKTEKSRCIKRVKYLQFDISAIEKEFPDVLMSDLKTGIASYIDYISPMDDSKQYLLRAV